MSLQIVLSVEFERIFFKIRLGISLKFIRCGEGRVFVIKGFVCLAYGGNTLLLSYLLNECPSLCSPAGEVVAGKKLIY